MQTKKLAFLTACLLSAAMLWGCGSNGSGGSTVGTVPGGEDTVILGNSSCQVCHATAHSFTTNPLTGSVELAAGGARLINHTCEDCHGSGQAHRGLGPIPVAIPTIERCALCHAEADEAQASVHVVNGVANCIGCHDTLRMVEMPSCVSCHQDLTAAQLKAKPFSDEINARFATGRHTGSQRAGNCAACHSHEGALVMFSKNEKFDTIAQIESLSDELAALGGTGSLSRKNCATCHDPHAGTLRGPEGVSETVTLASGLAWERQVYSKEFQLCTSCHQVNLDVSFNPNAGYNNAGAFEYQLSDVYAKSEGNPDPYTNKGIGYHTNSHLNRSFVDTHFPGELYKKLYYYDVKDGYVQAGDLAGDNFVGVLYAALNRQRTARVTPDGADYDRLVAFYEEYLASEDNVSIKGFAVNPGSDNACSACHDVHSANKVVKPATSPYPYAMNFEENIAIAIAYGEGMGEAHGNYMGEPFARNMNNANNGAMYASASCTPCHTGRDFVKITKGAQIADLGAAQWNQVACVTCHDMARTGDVTSPRTLPADRTFAFNSSAETLTGAQLGTVQLCFECHKGRIAGVDVTTRPDPVAGTTNYSISYLHYSPNFATHYGAASGMIALYPGKLYSGKSGTHSVTTPTVHEFGGVSGAATCVDCHDVHTNEIRPFNPTIRSGDFCVRCHDAAGVAWHAGGRIGDPPSINNWDGRPAKQRVTDLANLLIDVVYEEMLEIADWNGSGDADLQAKYDAFAAGLKTHLSALKAETDPVAGKNLLKAYIKERQTTFPSLKIAHAVTTWKVFYYEDKASWAHNRNFAYQMLHDAIEDIGGVDAQALATAIVARPVGTIAGPALP